MPINKSLLISDEGVYKLGSVLPFRYGLCYFWWRRLQIRVSVTVREWLIPANIPSKISCFLRWRRLQIRISVTVQVWLMPVNIIPWNPGKLQYNYFWWRRLQIRVSVTVQVWFMPINKSLLISDEGVSKLGLVLPFRYGLCYFWWRHLQIRVSVTVREWLIPTNISSETDVISYESAYKLGKKIISDGGIYKVQASFISINIPHTVQANFITHKKKKK